MVFSEGLPRPASFDVDEWDENFINEVLQVELGLSSKNTVANPADSPPTVNPSSSCLLEQETFKGLNPSPLTRSERDVCFSPPRELSQRFPEMPESVPIGNNCVKVDNRVSKNEVHIGVGLNRKNKEVERLKSELERLSKKFTHMEQEYNTLKKDGDKKSEQLKYVFSELEAKDVEIHNLKRENLGATAAVQPKLNGFKADGLAVSEQKCHVMFDVEATTSLEVQECFSTKKCINMKHRKTEGIQTDIGHDSGKQGIASKLQAIWGLCDRRPGNNLVTKLLETCSEDFLALFRFINMPSNCILSGLPNESFFEMTFPDNAQSAYSNDAAKAFRFYQSLMKMRLEIVPLQVVIDALLDLCNHNNVTVAHVSLRILHATLRHLDFDFTIQRSNVIIGQSNDNGSMPVSSIFGSLCTGEDQDSRSIIGLSFESSLNIFEMMRGIVVEKVQECIRFEGLSIMSLIMMESKPNTEREKFCSIKLFRTLSILMSKDAGVHVRKLAACLLFLLLNSPKMLLMLCSGQGDDVDNTKVDNTQDSTALMQREVKYVLKNIAECLTLNQNCVEELKFRRRVIILLAFIASGKNGFKVLLLSVTSQQINFLELVIQLLAFEMDAETPGNVAIQDLYKERISLIREVLILLNRLASHPSYSDASMRVLTSRKPTSSLTIDIANRLPSRIKVLSKQHETKKTQVWSEIHDLAQLFRSRVFSFLGAPES